MATRRRQQHINDTCKQEEPEGPEKGGGGSCCCFGSSKPRRPPQANTTDGSMHENITQEQKQEPNRSFLPTVKPSERPPNMARHHQPQIEGNTYVEFESSPKKTTTSHVQGCPSPTDQLKNTSKKKINGNYSKTPECSSEEDHNRSWGLSPLKDEGKGNNGNHGGTKSATTKSAISSADHAESPPLKNKDKVNSPFELVGTQPRREKEKAIGSTGKQVNPAPKMEEKESNLPKHSYQDPVLAQYKNNKQEYDQENNKTTRSDLLKDEETTTSSPKQTVIPKGTDKQREANRLAGINNNHDD